MFRTGSNKRYTFRPMRPKHLGFDQVRPSEICSDRHQHKILCFDPDRPSKVRFDRRGQNIYVSTKFAHARYVLTGATKTSRFRPSSTKRDTFRPARPQHLCFDQARYVLTGATKTTGFGLILTKRDMFRRNDHEILCFEQVGPSEIRFVWRYQKI